MVVQSLPALSVKVVEIDHYNAVVMLPMHAARFRLRLIGEERHRVHAGDFYDARIAREGDKHNILVIRVPREKPARYQIVSVIFEE